MDFILLRLEYLISTIIYSEILTLSGQFYNSFEEIK